MSEICERLGANIRQVRKIRNMTMTDLANAIMDKYDIDLSQSIIGAWERGERRISADNLYMLSQVLGCSTHTLFGIYSDVRVEAGILSEHERQIIEYMFNEWDGDTHAMIEFVGMYMAADRETRHEMANTCLSIFRYARNHGMKSDVTYDIRTPFISKKCNELAR